MLHSVFDRWSQFNKPKSILMLLSVTLVCSANLQAHTDSDHEVSIQALPSPARANSIAPRFTTSPDGKHWLSWLERGEKTQRLLISAFDGDAFSPSQLVIEGDDWFVNWADTPHLFAGKDDWMVAQWLQKSGSATYAYDVKLSYSQDAGQHWSQSLSPHHDGTASEHGFLSFFPSAEGAGMVWLDGRNTPDGGAMTLRAGVLTPAGQLTHESEIDVQVCDCCQTGATAVADGAFVVYRNRTDAEIRDIFGAYFDGQHWSQPIRVSNDNWEIAGCPVNGPQVVSVNDEVAVAWFTMAEGIPTVRLSRSQQERQSFQNSTVVAQGDTLGRVALAYSGKYLIVAWIDENKQQAFLNVAWYEPDQLRKIEQIRVAEVPRGRASGFPALAVNEQQQVLISWTAKEEKELRVKTARLQLH